MKRILVASVVAVLAVATGNTQPASPKGLQDEGTFGLYVNEERIGTLTFKLGADGSFTNEAVLGIAGQTATTVDTVVVDADGRWTRLETRGAQGTITTIREGDTAKRTFKEKTDIITVKPGAVLFSNYGPALMSVMLRQYDRAKGGKQALSVIVLPGAAVGGSLELKETVERSVAGKDLPLDHFLFEMAGIELHLYADATGKLYLAEVPQQRAAYVRDGYESLRKATDTDTLISKPTFDIVAEQVMAPARDGVRLATAVWRPKGEGRFPVVLIRTPYKKEMLELNAKFYARRGYAVAVQDCRGRFGSEGTWEPFVHERKDGYDAVEWAAAQPWSNGKVGMIGGSYVGWVQWWAAVERPPHLVTIVPNVSPPDPFYNIPYEYGTFFVLGAIWWADILESNATADLSGAAMSRIGEKKYMQLLRPLPVIDLDRAILGKENAYWRTWIRHPDNDAYWARANFLDELKRARIPVFHQSGWFDGDGIGTKLNYQRMAAAGHPNQKLIVGPWGHTDTATRRLGNRDFGAQAIVDLQRQYLRWFDYWLKGTDNGILKEPLVKIYVMGANRWLEGTTYPLPETRFEKWYLTSSAGANTSKGDGRLTTEAPPARSKPDTYVYDPGDPTPDPRFYEVSAEEEKTTRTAAERRAAADAYHEHVTTERRDMLVYQTEPLTAPLTIAGPISAVLHASTSGRDTDWFMNLVEIDAKGKTFWLCTGRIRARYRTSMAKPVLLKPGQPYQYTLDLWHTGIRIPEGSRLRVEVSSAQYPTFSRNLNTGGHNEVETKYVSATQTIYHDAKRPSHIVLPVIPERTTTPTARSETRR
jgi:putative CocE/NonD family hydrolase